MEVTEATAKMQGSAEPKARQGLDFEIWVGKTWENISYLHSELWDMNVTADKQPEFYCGNVIKVTVVSFKIFPESPPENDSCLVDIFLLRDI